jgi:hypothetical protein
MDAQTVWQAFHNQREEFCRLHEAQVNKDHSGLSVPSAARALAFAESLILCPTLEAVQVRMRQDLEGARSFLMVADRVVSINATINAETLEKWMKNSVPFYLLASVVLEQLETSKSTQPYLWV